MKKENLIVLILYCFIPWIFYFALRPAFYEDANLQALAFIGGSWLIVSPMVIAIGMYLAYNERRLKDTEK